MKSAFFYCLAISPALADVQSPPAMLPDASNAALPTARTNLGLAAPLAAGVLPSSAGQVATAGAGYAPGDTVTVAGGTAATNAILAITDTQAVSGSVAAGGSGGTNGACTVTGTTGSGTRAQFTGTVVSGALTGPLTVALAGDYTANPTTPSVEPVAGCGLAGAQVNMTLGALGFQVQNPGVYTAAPANPVAQGSTSGTGSGASFTLSWGGISAAGSFPPLNPGGLGAGNGNTIGGLDSGHSLTTGAEETFYGYRTGYYAKNGSFLAAFGHNAMGSGGACTSNFNWGSSSAFGTDAMRNWCGGNNATALGTSALKNYSQQSFFGANLTAVGTSSMLNLNSASGVNDTAVGMNSCQGASGSQSFNNGNCFGEATGGALTTASKFLILGTGVGNTTFASGTGVILIGSGNVTVDTPAAGTSNYLNIENFIIGDTAKAHFVLNGSTPAIASGSSDCGTSPSISGNDDVGLVTVGSSTNGSKCTITFAQAWVTAPVCIAQNQTTGNLLRPTSTTTTLTLNGTLTAADKLSYHCKGYAL